MPSQREVIVHFTVQQPEAKFRAWLQEGGYSEHDTFLDARNADSLLRGPVVSVEKIERSLLWSLDTPSKEGTS